MPIIVSHRGNLAGPSADAENRLPAVRDALALGWSVQLDIRRDEDGQFYLSNDPQQCVAGLVADDFCALFRRFPHATIALKLRELGDEAALVAYLAEQRVLDQVFLFDMERLERQHGETAARLRTLDPRVQLAARVSDRAEPVDRALRIASASVIWVDESHSPWCTEEDVWRMKSAGRAVYAVSPDLRGRSFEETRARWLNFINWGVDGICTNYPAALDRFMQDLLRNAAA